MSEDTDSGRELTENEVVRDLAMTVADPIELPDGPQSHTIPEGATLLVLDPEALRPIPRRARGTVMPDTVDALASYVASHGEMERSEVWVGAERIVGVMNAHMPDHSKPEKTGGWGDHRAVLTLQHSPQWKHWLSKNGQMVDQATFAYHVEEGLEDIVEPQSAELLEIVQHFQVTRGAQFRSSQFLESGVVKFEYAEDESKARAGLNGDFEIPSQFTLGIPVYVGEDLYRITARFRYRVSEGKLTMGYKLERPELVVQATLEGIARRLADRLTEARVLPGRPAEPLEATLIHRSPGSDSGDDE